MLATDAAPRSQRKTVLGKGLPRIGPPLPAIGRLNDYKAAAELLGIKPYPWQLTAARYCTATDGRGMWRYRDFTAVVSRRNGKTEFALPRILMALDDGEVVLHTAQDRALPRLTFEELADKITDEPELKKKVRSIRTANGTESIRFHNGGRYILLAPGHGVRGHQGDLTVEDEVREQRDTRLQRALGPTTLASKNPQRVRLSNAGDEDSVVLNELRLRMDEGGTFCYLEWSAAPERDIDDRVGWAEANPALGHGLITMTMLEDARRTQTPAGFETEHLCRWVKTMAPKLLSEERWLASRATLEKPVRPTMAISMDPSGTKASAVMAWQQTDGTIGLRVIADVFGSPIDVDAFGKDLKTLSVKSGVFACGYDPWTDADLARYVHTAKIVNGREFANASENFARLVESGRIHWDSAEQVTADLAWTARKPHETGAWMAVKAKEDRPITAVLAAIRAVWLASGPRLELPQVF